LVFEVVLPVEFESAPVVVPEVAPPVVTSMLSIVMLATVMSEVVAEVADVSEALPVWFVLPVELDEPEPDVDPALAVPATVLSIVMLAIVMSEVVPEVADVSEALSVWFVPAVVLDEPEPDVDPALAMPALIVPVFVVTVFAVPVPVVPVLSVPPVLVEPLVVPPSKAWSTS
jgi:hypothetical protein